jgi:hypothetical protein
LVLYVDSTLVRGCVISIYVNLKPNFALIYIKNLHQVFIQAMF